MEHLCSDYESGKWVPAHYGNKFTVAHKTPGTQSDLDLSVKVKTLGEAQTIAAERNRAA